MKREVQSRGRAREARAGGMRQWNLVADLGEV